MVLGRLRLDRLTSRFRRWRLAPLPVSLAPIVSVLFVLVLLDARSIWPRRVTLTS